MGTILSTCLLLEQIQTETYSHLDNNWKSSNIGWYWNDEEQRIRMLILKCSSKSKYTTIVNQHPTVDSWKDIRVVILSVDTAFLRTSSSTARFPARSALFPASAITIFGLAWRCLSRCKQNGTEPLELTRKEELSHQTSRRTLQVTSCICIELYNTSMV